MINKTVNAVLLFIHFLLTRGAAIVILGSWVWYMSPSFNKISSVLETIVEVTLSALGANQFFSLLIMQSKPEQVILFMLILIPLYIIFSFVLYPLRKTWFQRTLKMVVIHFVALVTLYVLAWFAGDFFKQLMETALLLRDYIFDLMGSSGFAERTKAFVRLVEPRTILAVILITVFFYLLVALPSMMRFLLGKDDTALSGAQEAALFNKK